MYLKKLFRKLRDFNVWFFIFFIHSPRFEIYVRKLNQHNKKYFSIVKNDQINSTDIHLQTYYFKSIPKKLWIYWAQGESESPLIVQKCISSWRKHNPDWEITILDANNLKQYVQFPTLSESLPLRYHANLLRTKLLNQYGGVWADATTYCHRPLSEWLPLVSNSGLFMFGNAAQDRDIENWFIASTKNNPLIHSWQNRLEKYYLKMKRKHPSYFLAFYIFQWMLKQENDLENQYRQSSKINAVPCFLMTSVLMDRTPYIELERHIQNGLPVSKLAWKLNITNQNLLKKLNEIEKIRFQKGI